FSYITKPTDPISAYLAKIITSFHATGKACYRVNLLIFIHFLHITLNFPPLTHLTGLKADIL
ncbi:MAG: hypothetical protein KKE94_02760, partial [Gammaproteobacteria bacterium]|nr:hypothetical protein [Gammaproteobacteria bacterium]